MKINPSSLVISTIATIILIAVMTVVAEMYSPFKTMLANMAGHHWVSKGIISLVFFAIVYFAFIKKELATNAVNQALYVLISVVLSGAAIFVFYILHFLKIL